MQFIYKLSIAALALYTSIVSAQVTSGAVNKNSCSRYANTTQPFILVLNSDEDLISSISQCAKDAKLKAASVSGLGQVHDPVLAYFSADPKAKPTQTQFPGYYELASLKGDITNNNGNYYTHLHAVLADKQFHGIAGHVDTAKVGLTAEITIIPLSKTVQRTVDAETGFGPIVAS